MTAVLRPGPKLCLYSSGWSDVPDHVETLADSFVFDISEVGHYPDQSGPRGQRWESFGGDRGSLDNELASNSELDQLLELLTHLIFRFLASGRDTLIIAVICAWGKHRSRWIIE